MEKQTKDPNNTGPKRLAEQRFWNPPTNEYANNYVTKCKRAIEN